MQICFKSLPRMKLHMVGSFYYEGDYELSCASLLVFSDTFLSAGANKKFICSDNVSVKLKL